MFQSLRAHSQFYVLNKKLGSPTIEIGRVVSVSAPLPKFQIPQNYGQPLELIVDVVVDINGHNVTYQRLPANKDIAEFGNDNIIVSCSRDAINSEAIALRLKSVDIVNSIDLRKNDIMEYDKIILMINPEYAEKQKQQNEINNLKELMTIMALSMESLVSMNKELMTKLGGNSNKS